MRRRNLTGSTLFFAVLACSSVSSGGVFAQALTAPSAEQQNPLILGPHLEIHEDVRGTATLADVQNLPPSQWFRRPQEKRPSFGFSTSPYWARFTIQNPAPNVERRLLLEFAYPMLDSIELHAPDGSVQRGGDLLPFRERSVQHRNVVFPLRIPAGASAEYYVRVSTDSAVLLPLRLWSEDGFRRHAERENRFFTTFYSIILVMFVFNLLLFLSVRERAIIYYVLYLAAIYLFLFTLDGLAFQYLWPDWVVWANRSLPFFIHLGYVTGLLFAWTYLERLRRTPRLNTLILWLWRITLVAAPVSLFVPYAWSIIASTALAVFGAMAILAAALVNVYHRRRTAIFYTISWFALLTGILLYSLKTFALLPDGFLSTWGMHIGVLAQIVLLSLGIADRINVLRLDLKKRLEDLRHAGQDVRRSERKYKHLVESTGDIIFSLNGDGLFLTANRAIRTQLGIKPADLIGRPFFDLLYRSPELEEILPGTDFQRDLIRQEFENVRRSGKSANFKAEFATHLGEPRQLEVRLERVDAGESDGSTVVFGKAGTILDDSLIRFIEAERQQHVIGNFLNIVDLLSERLTKNLSKYTDGSNIMGVHICLREMLINAVEHGNLAVSYEEKTALTDREQYVKFLLERQKDPRFRDRKITVLYSLNRRRVFYRITDEGDGFDHQGLFHKSPDDPNKEGLAHGRGVTMTRNIFDVVRYNDKGNQVTLVKYFS